LGFLVTIYIIIWLSLYVLSVHSLSPPKPAGLDPPIFRRRTLYYMRKSLGIKVICFFEEKKLSFFLKLFFWRKKIRENAERSDRRVYYKWGRLLQLTLIVELFSVL
jgi:hypothetical protein